MVMLDLPDPLYLINTGLTMTACFPTVNLFVKNPVIPLIFLPFLSLTVLVLRVKNFLYLLPIFTSNVTLMPFTGFLVFLFRTWNEINDPDFSLFLL